MASVAGRIIKPSHAVLLLAILAALVPLAYGQIGEVAGQLNFQIQVGHSQTLTLTVLNEGSTPIGFAVLAPSGSQLQVTSARNSTVGQTRPTIVVYPMNGTIPARGAATINVTVSMPLNDTPGKASYEGIIQVLQSSNQTNPGGAVLQEGVAKIFSVGAIPSTTTTTSVTTTIPGVTATTASALSYTTYLIPVIWLAIIVLILWYLTAVKRFIRAGGKPARLFKGAPSKAAAGRSAAARAQPGRAASRKRGAAAKATPKGKKASSEAKELQRQIAELKRQNAALQKRAKTAPKAGRGAKKAKKR